jgi:hypothetical protein
MANYIYRALDLKSEWLNFLACLQTLTFPNEVCIEVCVEELPSANSTALTV